MAYYIIMFHNYLLYMRYKILNINLVVTQFLYNLIYINL